MNNIKQTLCLLLFFPLVIYSQETQKKDKNWHHKNFQKDGVCGIDTDKAYQYLKNKKSNPVIVAVLDVGIDVTHKDLIKNLWVNKDEIIGNGIDDDGNGFIDDIHGWNFLGNDKGENIYYARLEEARIYSALYPKFKDIDSLKVKKKDRDNYKLYQEVKTTLKIGVESAKAKLKQYQQIKDAIVEIEMLLGDKACTATNLDALNISSQNPFTSSIRDQFSESMKNGTNKSTTIEELKKSVDKQLAAGIKSKQDALDYFYNPDYKDHQIIASNFDSSNFKYYGNNNYLGNTKDYHGNHVAGIIGAIRNNNLGMDGIAENVKIMSIKMIEEGDEHDTDVANAIRYAVDNDAKVINMSFGKSRSLYKNKVDKAIKYAKKRDVLIVQGAGNAGKEITLKNNFPNAYTSNGRKIYDGWITVGAISNKKDSLLIPYFSNYSKKYVDVFAPGVSIYSLGLNDEYEFASGTSQATPVVSGVAALLLSYFPDLSATEIKEVILKSSTKINSKVKLPNAERLVPFKNMSVSGGVINLYQAVILADEMSDF